MYPSQLKKIGSKARGIDIVTQALAVLLFLNTRSNLNRLNMNNLYVRRKTEMDQLYAEEAEQMAAKQEEVWAREAAARQRLMEEVAASWRKVGQRS